MQPCPWSDMYSALEAIKSDLLPTGICLRLLQIAIVSVAGAVFLVAAMHVAKVCASIAMPCRNIVLRATISDSQPHQSQD